MPDAPRRHVAVLDVGKSNAKLVLFDLQARQEIAARTMPNDVREDGPYPHFQVDRTFDFAMDSLAEFVRRARIDALSITTHGASAALLGADGLALPILDYEHEGPDEVADSYDRERPGFAETFSPRLPNGLNLGAQLFWQAQSFPAQFARVARIVTYPQYWAWRFTGIAATEVTSLGCHTDLWNPRNRCMSSLVARLGWDRLMAPVRSAFDALGPTRSGIARRTGLAPDTLVYCGLHDSNASLLPHLLDRRPPFTVVSTGTWVIVLGVGGSLDGLDAARDTLANVDAFGRPVPSARFMGGREYDLLTAGAQGDADPSDLLSVLERQVMMLPPIVPGSGPFPRARGGWASVERPRRTGETIAAATLYLALMTETCLALVGAEGPIVIEGPMAQNRLYCQVLVSLTRRAVHPMAGVTGTGGGASLLARGVPLLGAGLASESAAIPVYVDEIRLHRYATMWKDLCGRVASA